MDLWRYAQHLFHSLGELSLARGDGDQALAYADECLALAEPASHRKNAVKGRRLRAQVFLAQGRFEDAEREIRKALDTAKAIGNPPQLWKTHMTNAELMRRGGRPGAARASLVEAARVIEEVCASLPVELGRTLVESEAAARIRRELDSPEAEEGSRLRASRTPAERS